MSKKLNYLSKKLKDIKASDCDKTLGCYSGTVLEEKVYNSNNNGYDSLC